MWDHQVWFMYFLANSCKDSKRRYVSVADAITIVGDYYGYAITIHDSWPAYSNIGDENHSLYRMLTGVMKAGPEIAGHFEPKARDAYKDYSKRGMLANPAPLDSDS